MSDHVITSQAGAVWRIELSRPDCGNLVTTEMVLALSDERMFYQLVARDRWHGVLLGKTAHALETEQVNAPLIDRSRLARMRLRLAPARRIGKMRRKAKGD